MSLTGALSSAISALAAQSQALAMVGDNIANSDTTGYKTTSSLFEQLVTASNTARSYSSGGVSVLARANITQQGLLASSSTATDVAIQGAGFFVVKDAGGTTFFTRNGAVTPDKNGLLQNDGFFLQGWRTDANGNIVGGENPSNLTTINTEIAPVSAGATTKATIPTNLPADAPVSTTTPPTPFGTSSMTVYDSLGTPSTIQVSWTKTSDNTWTATFSNPSSPSDSTVTTGTTTGGPFQLTFDGATGKLSNVTPAPTLSVAWNDGAGTSSIALDMTSMTQFASGKDTPTMDNATIGTDGFPKGTLTNVTVGKNDGVVSATYSNGQTIPIYKIAVATFSDPTGLAANSDGMYTATGTSGNATYQASGEGAAGAVFGSALESSTTDTSGQFANMMSAQQAYSAASTVITTVNKMFDTLMTAMR